MLHKYTRNPKGVDYIVGGIHGYSLLTGQQVVEDTDGDVVPGRNYGFEFTLVERA